MRPETARRLRFVAIHIEQLRHVPYRLKRHDPPALIELTRNGGAFNMAEWSFSSGGPACIASHTVVLLDGFDTFRGKNRGNEAWGRHGLATAARRLLKLDKTKAVELFTPELTFQEMVTPRQAGLVLRDLADTGRVSLERWRH